MKKRVSGAIQIALLLVMICGLITGCAGLSSQVSQKTIATVTNMWVDYNSYLLGVTPLPEYGYSLFVELKPTRYALAETVYEVELYEKGNLRSDTSVAWNQPEINVSSIKLVKFFVTEEEYTAYYQKDVSHIFSVKVHE